MDICHKSHITQQSHRINKKLHYDEPTLHYPSITEPTLHYPLITMYTVRDYIQEYTQTTKQQIQLKQGTLRGVSIGVRASADPCVIWGPDPNDLSSVSMVYIMYPYESLIT